MTVALPDGNKGIKRVYFAVCKFQNYLSFPPKYSFMYLAP